MTAPKKLYNLDGVCPISYTAVTIVYAYSSKQRQWVPVYLCYMTDTPNGTTEGEE